MPHIQYRMGSALVAIAIGATALAASAMPGFGEWSGPSRVQSAAGPVGAIATGAVDGCVSLSRNGLELYFTSNRTGNFDLYVTRRSSVAGAFGPPQRLPATLNTPADEACPTIVGRNRLYFLRGNATDEGDIYVSTRSSKGWQPANPVSALNSSLLDEAVTVFEDEQGREVVLWSRRNVDGSGGKILQSVAGGMPQEVAGGPNAAGSNSRPSITHDGRTLFFDSTRPGGLGGPDLWYATRPSTDAAFGPAIHLGELNSAGFDARPAISWDGEELFYSSNRPGSTSPAPDIWMAKRPRSSGPKG
tara:strand:+ start:47519 stop:48427 length:909 start_codon:yes stop_codon:yes gene_type:complete